MTPSRTEHGSKRCARASDGVVRGGTITEIVGHVSSGRTSLFVTCLRDVSREGGVIALVDADVAFDPVGAAAGGVDLRRLLWVRCGGCRNVALRAVDALVRCPGFALIGLDVGEAPPPLSLAAAFRWRLAVRRTGGALVVVGRRRLLGAGASLVIETRPGGSHWTGPGPLPTRLAKVRTDVMILRRQAAQGGSARGVVPVAWWCA